MQVLWDDENTIGWALMTGRSTTAEVMHQSLHNVYSWEFMSKLSFKNWKQIFIVPWEAFKKILQNNILKCENINFLFF